MKNLSFFCALVVSFFVSTIYSQNPEQSIAPPGMLFELLALNKDLSAAAQPKYKSPCDMAASPDGKYIYVAEQTAKQIAIIDISTKAVVKNIKLPNEVTGIAVGPDGSRIYATCSSGLWPNGMVCEIDAAAGKVNRRLPAGHGARSPVISPAENILFVCNAFDNDVSIIDIASAREIKRIKAVREPCCAVITPDGATLVVGNALPDQRSTDTLTIACKVTLINAISREKIIDIPLPTGSHSIAGMAISPDGNYAFATHLIGLFSIPASQVTGGWIHTNNVAIVDIKNQKILNDVTLDSPAYGAGNPWGIDCTPDGTILCVTHAGSNELSVIDLQQLILIGYLYDYSPDPLVSPTEKVPLSHNLSALRNISAKIWVKGKEPRALTIIGNKAYTAGYFADSIEIFDLYLPGDTVNSTYKVDSIALGPEVLKTFERKGECAYYDASLCFQKWQSCHSCHPFNRADGLNWTLNAELNTPKNSKSMRYSWWTPPTMWAGKRLNAYEYIRGAFRSELFLEPNWVLALCMDTFFMKLKPVPSPHLVNGRLSASALRGKDIFFGSKAACGTCHRAPLYTDLKRYNAGSFDPYDVNTNWDTPSLIECWRTAPYGHLGSKLTVQEMLGLSGMGAVSSKLTQDEINDLVEFVLSL
jgi:YVTN family beta-propeller protein